MQDQSNFQRTSGLCGEAGHYRYSKGDTSGKLVQEGQHYRFPVPQ
jgi:hypothetical protein